MDLLNVDVAREIRSFLDIVNIQALQLHVLATRIHYITMVRGLDFSFKRCQFIAERILNDELKLKVNCNNRNLVT